MNVLTARDQGHRQMQWSVRVLKIATALSSTQQNQQLTTEKELLRHSGKSSALVPATSR